MRRPRFSHEASDGARHELVYRRKPASVRLNVFWDNKVRGARASKHGGPRGAQRFFVKALSLDTGGAREATVALPASDWSAEEPYEMNAPVSYELLSTGTLSDAPASIRNATAPTWPSAAARWSGRRPS